MAGSISTAWLGEGTVADISQGCQCRGEAVCAAPPSLTCCLNSMHAVVAVPMVEDIGEKLSMQG
eukprot:486890-Lingulodinium_polyedra.AAC.1